MRAALIVIVGAALLIAAAGPILSRVFGDKVKARLEAANIHIGSLSFNLFARSITLTDVEWSPDSLKSAKISNIRARGISIVNWLRGRHVSVKELSFQGGTVSITRDTVEREAKQDSIKVSGINIDRISLEDIEVKLLNDTIPEYQAKVRVIVHYLHLQDPAQFRDLSAYTFRNVETYVSDATIQQAGSLYAFKIREASFDKELKKLHIDSLSLEPLLGKADYAKKVKSQETRVTLNVASVDATGIRMAVHMDDTSVMVSSLIVNGANIHAYKNKKYPFTRKEKFLMPMEAFQSLRFGIELDTIKIRDSKITYEELPTEGFHTAHITFEDVEATMSAVNNREFKNLSGVSTLEASATVMKTGSVKATFKLPLEKKAKYTAEGTISNVPLAELNPLVTDLAFVEITSGKLNKMDFTFTYDDIGSQGQLHFDYEDLRIRGLKKQATHELAAFKTILINSAVKNAETLNGNINVQRNQKKAVFHLWTISLVDGIKDALIPASVKRVQENREKKNKKGK